MAAFFCLFRFALFCEKILSSEILSYEQFSSLLLDDLMRLKSDGTFH